MAISDDIKIDGIQVLKGRIEEVFAHEDGWPIDAPFVRVGNNPKLGLLYGFNVNTSERALLVSSAGKAFRAEFAVSANGQRRLTSFAVDVGNSIMLQVFKPYKLIAAPA
ncbi:MAG: hypothetical protein KGQ41_05770 [Alphaproteobacteria bacterium]|nr:hypothetical protein [Alphaproteobacteria bacterium]